MTFVVKGDPGTSESDCDLSILAVNPGFPEVTYLPWISCNTKLISLVSTSAVLAACKQFAIECDDHHKFKGVVVDPLLNEAATILEPALIKLFPKLDGTPEVQGIVHWAIQLGIKLQSPITP